METEEIARRDASATGTVWSIILTANMQNESTGATIPGKDEIMYKYYGTGTCERPD
jgi:hypothetical protein